MTVSKNFRTKLFVAAMIVAMLFVSSCKKSAPTTPDVPPVAPPVAPAPDDAAPAAVQPDANGMVPLPLELPTAMFVGTPQPIKLDFLEPVLAEGEERAVMMVPADVTNVAFEKSVSSSEEEPATGNIAQITDGDKEATDGSYVELGLDPQWIMIDLGEPCQINAIVAWHYHKQARAYVDVIVQLADDPDFITNVRTIFNNDRDNSAGRGIGEDMHYIESNAGRIFDAKGEKAQYVRLFSNGNSTDDFNHYIEVEVWGKTAK